MSFDQFAFAVIETLLRTGCLKCLCMARFLLTRFCRYSTPAQLRHASNCQIDQLQLPDRWSVACADAVEAHP